MLLRVQPTEQLSVILLDPAAETTVVNGACAALYDLFVSAAAATADAARTAAPSAKLTTGLALSPALEAQCLLDGRSPSSAGRCAPFRRRSGASPHRSSKCSTPAWGRSRPSPFCRCLLSTPRTFRFTLLDVNEASVRSVRALAGALGVSEYVRDIVHRDATAYQHPERLHVVISETMQRTLREEPFVSILRRLRPQLAAGALVVPERVTIELALLDAASQQRQWGGEPDAVEMEDCGIVFQVDAKGEFPFEAPTTLTVRCEASGAEKWLALATRIRVHGDEVLEPYASGLTLPEILWPLSPLKRYTTIELRYDTGLHPQVGWRELQDTSPHS